MPLEVSEIGISMRVTHESDADADRLAGERSGGLDDETRRQLIDECVERVLQALKAERER